MNFSIQKHPATILEHKYLLKIKDPFIMGIYTFLQMEMDKDIYDKNQLIFNMVNHFNIAEEKIILAMEIIVEELELINYKMKT